MFGLGEDLVGGFGPGEWLRVGIPAVDELTDRGGEVADTAEGVPRWMAWRSMMPNHASTRFIHDAKVGVKCGLILGFSASQSRTSCFSCAA